MTRPTNGSCKPNTFDRTDRREFGPDGFSPILKTDVRPGHFPEKQTLPERKRLFDRAIFRFARFVAEYVYGKKETRNINLIQTDKRFTIEWSVYIKTVRH